MSAPPDLSSHFEHIVTDRHLKAGRALAVAMSLTRGESVLELGCGTGLLSEYLADCVGMRGDVLGLDPSPYHMAIAHQRARPNLRFQVGSPLTLSRFPVGCFHAIVVNDLIHAWPDPGVPLAALYRILKPGGRLGLVTHCKDHPHPVTVVQEAVLAQAPFSDALRGPGDRTYPLSAAGLQAQLREAGFEMLDVMAQADVTVHNTVDAAIAFVQAGTWGQFLRHLPEQPVDLRAQAREQIAMRLARLLTAEGIRHRGLRLLAIATKATGE